jgi:hypothetical protein
MNVLVWTKIISVHKCHVGLYHFLSDFITFASSAAYPIQIGLIFNFTSSNYEFRKIQLMQFFVEHFHEIEAWGDVVVKALRY